MKIRIGLHTGTKRKHRERFTASVHIKNYGRLKARQERYLLENKQFTKTL